MRILEEVVKNTDMGICAINNIRSYVEDEALMHKILCQREDLKRIQADAESQLSEDEIEECKGSRIQQAMLKTGVKMNAMFDKSNRNIAEMIIEGTNMGINSVQQELNEMFKKGEDIPPIANELISLYEKNLHELRSFL